jgi:hypothetical protein
MLDAIAQALGILFLTKKQKAGEESQTKKSRRKMTSALL